MGRYANAVSVSRTGAGRESRFNSVELDNLFFEIRLLMIISKINNH